MHKKSEGVTGGRKSLVETGSDTGYSHSVHFESWCLGIWVVSAAVGKSGDSEPDMPGIQPLPPH